MKNKKERMIAKTLYNGYYNRYNKYPDEMTMHKLMYFLQREYLINNENFLFEEDFYGWKYGPVLKSVRSEFINNKKNHTVFNNSVSEIEDKQTINLINSVLDKYGSLNAWKLSMLSHDEFSWRQSRVGIKNNVNGDNVINKSLIKVDAVRENYNRKSV
ncbi:MAG: Panacea domain-containing protein [Peptoanaerobacter stomatis]